MIICENCKVLLDSQHAKCPLCGKPYANSGESRTAYPDYRQEYGKKEKAFTLKKLSLFLIICTIVVTATVNLLTLHSASRLWFLIVSISLLYLWVTIRNTFGSRTHLGGKTLIQFLSLSLLLAAIDIFSGGYRWSVNYVIPFLSLGSTFLISMFAAAKKSRWNEYMGYLLAAFFISLVLLISFFTGLSQVLWPSVVAGVYSILTVIGLYFFSDKKFREEVKKRFYF